MIRLFKFLGTEVKLHWSLLIPFGITCMNWHSTLILLLCFGLVILHEFGHILVARRYGIVCDRVILSCIGGMACLDKEPQTPWQEFIISICGPLVNVALLIPAIYMGLQYPVLKDMPFALSAFIVVNLFLVLFNAIPAYPMDGGRVLKSLVWALTNRWFANKFCVVVSVIIASAGIIYGVLNGAWHLTLVALFIQVAALASWKEPEDVECVVENVRFVRLESDEEILKRMDDLLDSK